MTSYFAQISALYRQARPTYPPPLFQWIAHKAPARHLLWEPGCGSGQATLSLAQYFHKVIATDPSPEQLREAPPHPHIAYRCEPAERPSLHPQSADAIAVAQAYHWFDQEAFWQAVAQVAKPGALIAVWGYGDCFSPNPHLQAFLQEAHTQVDPYWPPERHHIQTAYQELPFPLPKLPTPTWPMEAVWPVERILAYIYTWSALRRWKEGEGWFQAFAQEVLGTFGEGTALPLAWPFFLRAGYWEG
ncbi:MAG: class I SAM-dependent methyltransferase [Bacteroidia bacterium]|nr:class I SAM-dependent methyltransferase [Bacteroidia bacterium]GIV22829.1 MAG: SAM-dependent methyltransferase [Bacteroidia bacterium]